MKRFKLLSTALLTALITTVIPTSAFAESGGIIYEEKDTGSNMGQSFVGSATVTYGQTPSYTVKIPKSITLDSDGAAKYSIGVKGQIPSKYVVSIIPDETILMEEENALLDSITADVTAEKTIWAAGELTEDTYNEITNNTVQMRSIDYGKFQGTLNFNVSAEIAIEVGSEADLANFTYTLDDATKTVSLTKYTGSATDVIVYGKYESSGEIYNTEIASAGLFESKTTITSVFFKDGIKVMGEGCKDMFNHCSALTELDLSGLDTSNVTDMTSMFYYCYALTELDLSGLDTSNVTNMTGMFSACSGLTELDLSGLDTSNVTNMTSMFSACSGLTEFDLSVFDTSRVTSMQGMFSYCSKLTELDLTYFDTSNVTNMNQMFFNCEKLTSIKVSSATWVEASSTNMMFSSCGVSSITKV